MGDVKFREYGGVETAPAHRWRVDPVQPPLADVTWDVARAVGYAPEPGPGQQPVDRPAEPNARRAAETARRKARRERRRGTRQEYGPND